MVYFYAALLGALAVLALISIRERVPREEGAGRLLLPFEKIASLLLRPAEFIRRKTGRGPLGAGDAERLNMARLSLLGKGDTGRNGYRSYLVKKIGQLLLFVTIADLMALLLVCSERFSEEEAVPQEIQRPAYGEEPATKRLAASYENVDLGEYSFVISPRQFTKRELAMKAEEVFTELEQKLQGDNASLSEVTGSLYMPASLADYPFFISWESSAYEYVDSDGTVFNEEMAEGESVAVTVTAILTLEGNAFRKDYSVRVVPARRTTLERMRRQIETALHAENEESRAGTLFRLPETVAGTPVTWKVPQEENDGMLFLMILIVGIVLYISEGRELEKQLHDRSRQMKMDYPKLCSRLVLYIGAGLSVRASFRRIGMEYEHTKEADTRRAHFLPAFLSFFELRDVSVKKRYLFEEILLMLRELDSGIPEAEAYGNFGKRCGDVEFSRFVSLLCQNLRKGNAQLLTMLREETENAYRDRRNIARQMGEEATAKLLFPMILMLIVTMVLIIFPAYRGFGF